jgi:leishmanolysin-like peptidase
MINLQVVVTPRVREEVQRHYKCDQLSGAELEDQGEEGTALTHWEKRLFEVSYDLRYHKEMIENCF